MQDPRGGDNPGGALGRSSWKLCEASSMVEPIIARCMKYICSPSLPFPTQSVRLSFVVMRKICISGLTHLINCSIASYMNRRTSSNFFCLHVNIEWIIGEEEKTLPDRC